MANRDCRCDTGDWKFDEAYAAGKLARYRSMGPDPSTRLLIDMISSEEIRGKTLLDIGGGVGAIQHELLRMGVASAQDVEASVAYVDACRREADRQGHADRIAHFSGDFGSLAGEVMPADIVTLDRSVCCWPDPLALVDQSAAASRWLYGVVYPRDAWWVRHGWRNLGNARQIVKRSGLRLSTPRTADVERILARHGLRRRRHARSGVWQIALFAKDIRRDGDPVTPARHGPRDEARARVAIDGGGLERRLGRPRAG
jgi:hypothetical protein